MTRERRDDDAEDDAEKELALFGSLPAKYQLIVWFCGLAAFAGLGALVSPRMATAGLMVGTLAVTLFLHDFGQPRSTVARPR